MPHLRTLNLQTARKSWFIALLLFVCSCASSPTDTQDIRAVDESTNQIANNQELMSRLRDVKYSLQYQIFKPGEVPTESAPWITAVDFRKTPLFVGGERIQSIDVDSPIWKCNFVEQDQAFTLACGNKKSNSIVEFSKACSPMFPVPVVATFRDVDPSKTRVDKNGKGSVDFRVTKVFFRCVAKGS